jgi:hypothetical protein
MDKRWGARNNTKGLSSNRQVGKYPLIGIICVNGIGNRNNDISFTTVRFLFNNIVLIIIYILYIYIYGCNSYSIARLDNQRIPGCLVSAAKTTFLLKLKQF